MCWNRARSFMMTRPKRWRKIPRSRPPISARPKRCTDMANDFVLRNARIAGRGGETFDIACRDGVIEEIAPRIASDAQSEDAGGRLVLPGFVDRHIHLDKSCIRDRCHIEQGTLKEAIAQVAAAKRGFTEEDVYARASRTLEKAVLQGTTAMRTHVEVDARIGLTSLDAVKRLKADYAW